MKRTELVRKTPMSRAPSLRKRRFERELNAVRPTITARSGGMCEARLPVCTTWAQHIHHIGGKKRRDANSYFLLLHLCLACHDDIHAHPARSYSLGHLVRKNGPLLPAWAGAK